jgi:glycosyltransferase involved in cell wall biosynthesis
LKIALCSKAFLPDVGGIETSTAMMARTWAAAGHDVEVVTAVPDDAPWTEPYRVTRTWTPASIMSSIKRCDVVAVNGYSRLATAAAVAGRRRVIVFHQGYQLICSDGLGFRGQKFHEFDTLSDIKLAFDASPAQGLRAVARVPFDAAVRHWPRGIEHVVPSRHVGDRLGLVHCRVIYQPPNPAVIEGVAEMGAPTPAARSRAYESGDVVFFGRLVFEKGCDDLIRAYDRWRRESADSRPRTRPPRLVLYGRGPELGTLEALVSSLGIAAHVSLQPFLGGRELALAARNASVVVVPSRWEEPGATIGVELFACGAAVIASQKGALGEIFAGHGRLFENGDVASLATALRDHFSVGPLYPKPSGHEPWLVPEIRRALLSVLDRSPG